MARGLQLQPALDRAVQAVGVAAIDPELHRLVPAPSLDYLAGLHLRGERVFPVPTLIRHTPQLIGYYRMLLGISKKDFSQANKLGYGPWATAEDRNTISRKLEPYVEDFCQALVKPLVELVDATKLLKPLEDRDLNDLALLTLGPTLQGGRNNLIGQQASVDVFAALYTLVRSWLTLDTPTRVQFQTPHSVMYELLVGSDPDISLSQLVMEDDSITVRYPIIAMEIKGGEDASNAHNRIGEAEKSHLRAKAQGYRDRWTIMVMRGLDRRRLSNETPSSTQLFDARAIRQQSGADWDSFRRLFGTVIGVPVP